MAPALIRNRLPTQALLLSYGQISIVFCGLCNSTPDSRDHLYFECHISSGLASFWASCRGQIDHVWRILVGPLNSSQTLVVPALKYHLTKVVKDKALTFKHVADTLRNRRLQRSWVLNPSLFSS